MKQNQWAAEVVKVIAESVVHHRTKEPKISAQKLADRCRDLGYPALTRSVIASLEVGGRDSLSVAEWLILAAALRVPPDLLLFPVGRLEVVEPLPDVTVPPITAVQWAETGRLPAKAGYAVEPSSDEDAQLIRRFRSHRDLVSAWEALNGRKMAALRFTEDEGERTEKLAHLDGEQNAIVNALRDLRELLRSGGLTPPDLPSSYASAELAAALGEADDDRAQS